MTRERWEQLRTLLAAAIEVPEPQRTPAYINRLCERDPTLISELQSLLTAHERPEAPNLDVPMFRFPADRSEVPLIRGTRLATYEILSPLGAGGMGDVYCARDTKLERDVALKILPDSFAQEPDRLVRFRREAQVLAALNHPHIATIYGLEEVNGTHFLVLELVNGESMDKRLARGPIPITETLSVAKQIAEALEAAHEKGIIHRDLKPANIALNVDGEVKVLDFGLAKAIEASDAVRVDPANVPTLMLPAAMTSTSLIVGTPAYMAPEQASGKIVDKRADIWAFGVVIYEMLTGRRAFAGESHSDVLAKVLEREPDWDAVPKAAPLRLLHLLARCLTKDPKTRLRDVGEARVLIDALLHERPDRAVNPVSQHLLLSRPRVLMPWLMAAGALVLGIALFTLRAPGRQPVAPPLRLSIELGADIPLAITRFGAATSLSPDGTVMAFVGQKAGGGVAQLYVRPLTQPQATPLTGTDGVQSPFFSPDGQWIAFFAGGHLKKIPVTGGLAVTLADAPNPRGGAWGDDGTIVFSPGVGPAGRLLRVSSTGGPPAPVTTLVPGEVNQRWPEILPGARAVLFTSTHTPSLFDDADLVVQALPSGDRKVVVQRGGSYPRYVRSGHLLYLHDGKLLAAPFDLTRLEVTGPPVAATEDVVSDLGGAAQMAVSASGTLAYLPGPSRTGSVPIHWLDRQGTVTPLRATPTNWTELAFAPDGRRLALVIADGAPSHIWVYEWARDTLTRLTVDPANHVRPVWTPDGRRIVFASERADKSTLNLYWQRADGFGDAQRLTESPYPQAPASWHPSGKFLAFVQLNPQTGYDLMILPMEGDEASGWNPGKPTVFLKSVFSELHPMFSPDGRWIAYQSNESGRPEVYVRPFPGAGGKWQVSSNGGGFPIWSRTKHELFYGTLDEQIMVATYAVEGEAFHAEKPRLWSDKRYVPRTATWPFDLHPDGEQFALTAAAEVPGVARHDHVTVIFNMFDELRRIAPPTRR
jgi:serine/threonine protein kinase/Tol biopolymer transport system component